MDFLYRQNKKQDMHDLLAVKSKGSSDDSIPNKIKLKPDSEPGTLNMRLQNAWEQRERGEMDNERLKTEVEAILGAYKKNDKNRPKP